MLVERVDQRDEARRLVALVIYYDALSNTRNYGIFLQFFIKVVCVLMKFFIIVFINYKKSFRKRF